MKTKINIIIYCGVSIIAIAIAGAFYENYAKKQRRQDLTAPTGFTSEDRKVDRGIITKLWIEPAHTKSRKNLETGEWEYADMPEAYWMEVTDTTSHRSRQLTVARQSYDMYLVNYQNGVQQFTQIFEDTASYNHNQRRSSMAAETEAEQARLVITPEVPK